MTLHAALGFVEVQALLPVMVTGAGQDANAIPRFPSLYSKRKKKAVVIIITTQEYSNKSQLLKIMKEYVRSVGSLPNYLTVGPR